MFVINAIHENKNGYVQITLDMAEFIDIANQYNSCGIDDLNKREQLTHDLRSHKQALLNNVYDPMFIMNFFNILISTISEKNSILFRCLADPHSHINKPLAFDCVSLYFTEIIKNSIDSFAVKSLAAPQASTILSINTQAWMVDEHIVFSFEDNGCGFPQTQLDSFDQFKANCCDKNKGPRTAHPTRLGGNHRALRQIRDYLLNGTIRDANCVDNQICVVTPGDSNLRISNNEAGGATIELSSRIIIKNSLEIMDKPTDSPLPVNEMIELKLPIRVKRRQFNRVHSSDSLTTASASPGFFAPTPTPLNTDASPLDMNVSMSPMGGALSVVRDRTSGHDEGPSPEIGPTLRQ